jgi:cysteine-S-conjugate beta-lyase
MHDETKLVALGRDPAAHHGAVNTPVYHVSTVLHSSIASLRAAQAARERDERVMVYGRTGTPTSFAFEDAVAALEGGHRCQAYPSGLSAVSAALLAFVKAGDHVLVSDSVYAPTRFFCDRALRRFGVETTYYDPLIGAGIAAQLRPNTAVVMVESPGSHTFEVQDIPAIAAAAHGPGRSTHAVVLADNTWASPLYCRPLALGADVSIQAATKYIVGHSDANLGAATATEQAWPALLRTARQMGLCAGPDDINLAQRGLRTLAVRLSRHQESALAVAAWLQTRPEVKRVLYPALPSDPGHALWRRDFTGASGLFSIELRPCSDAAVAAMVDNLELFGIGYSWGGFESLIVPYEPEKFRTATPWRGHGPLLRLHIGLEAVEDLLADLAAGFGRLNAAR